MIKNVRNWIDDRYFEGLRKQAASRLLQRMYRLDPADAGTPEDPKGSGLALVRVENAVTLINAGEVFCKLSRKIVEQPMAEATFVDCMLDFGALAVSIYRFVDGSEHDLESKALTAVLDRAASLAKSRGRQIADNDPILAERMTKALNVPMHGVDTWADLEALISEVRSKLD